LRKDFDAAADLSRALVALRRAVQIDFGDIPPARHEL